MDGGGVVRDEPFEVVIHLEVVRHVAVLLPVCLIKLHKDGDILKGVCETAGTFRVPETRTVLIVGCPATVPTHTAE